MTNTPTTFVADPAQLKAAVTGMASCFVLRVAMLTDQTIYFDGEVVARVSGIFPVAVDALAVISANGTVTTTRSTVLLLQDNGHLYAASAEGTGLRVLPSIDDLFYAHSD